MLKSDEYRQLLKRNFQLRTIEIRKWRNLKRKLFKCKWESDLTDETRRLFNFKPIDLYENIQMYTKRDILYKMKFRYYSIVEKPDYPNRLELLAKHKLDIEEYCRKHRDILKL